MIRENLLGDTELLKVFLQTHEKACNFLREKPQDAAELLAKESKAVNRNFILNTLSISPKYCASLPAEYLASTIEFVPVLKEMGYLKRSLLQEDIFDLSFIEAIHPELASLQCAPLPVTGSPLPTFPNSESRKHYPRRNSRL